MGPRKGTRRDISVEVKGLGRRAGAGVLRQWEQMLRNEPITGSPFGSRDDVQVGTRTGPSVPPAGSGRASVGPRQGVSETQKQVLAGSVQVCSLSNGISRLTCSLLSNRALKFRFVPARLDVLS